MKNKKIIPLLTAIVILSGILLPSGCRDAGDLSDESSNSATSTVSDGVGTGTGSGNVDVSDTGNVTGSPDSAGNSDSGLGLSDDSGVTSGVTQTSSKVNTSGTTPVSKTQFTMPESFDYTTVYPNPNPDKSGLNIKVKGNVIYLTAEKDLKIKEDFGVHIIFKVSEGITNMKYERLLSNDKSSIGFALWNFNKNESEGILPLAYIITEDVDADDPICKIEVIGKGTVTVTDNDGFFSEFEIL
ncbi:MAG: hypothetical protein FWF82_00860 [Oscillospiraceae bacterium]|nr:hypothetical protein [Oscillospiraceae bacterium]